MLGNGSGNYIEMPTIMQEMTRKAPSEPISTRVVSCTPGRLRLRVSQPHRQPGKMKRIASVLEANPQIKEVRTNVQNGSIIIVHNHENGNLDNVFATLQDLGIIFGELTRRKSHAAAGLTNAVVDLNQRVHLATNSTVDLRFLFPLGLSALAVRQLLNKGLQFETIPWYVLAWYAFDSFIKLHNTSEPESTSR